MLGTMDEKKEIKKEKGNTFHKPSHDSNSMIIKNENTGTMSDQLSQSVAAGQAKTPINYKDTWGRESGKQPGLMLEVLSMGQVPFKKLISRRQGLAP